jgi:hypothetical protein
VTGQAYHRWIAERRTEALAILDNPTTGATARRLAWHFLSQHRKPRHD